MAKVYDDGIDERMASWLVAQPVFTVATAPLAADGHVNVSPKGMAGTFVVRSPWQVAYLDYSGSGAETIAHLRDNGRITLMFASYDARPTIVRLYGRGEAVLAGDARFPALRAEFTKTETAGQRCVVLVDLDRVSDACGYAVPRMELLGERDTLDVSHARREDGFFEDYWRRRNAESIDGLPAVPVPPTTGSPPSDARGSTAWTH
ncbi:pyridoxamine 5'-phosphate oxidase family protein [Aquipuribacter sp. SD81]|uniref:pyridoxamine 5'-phosphate oxidase family protein n=1 Tax=Aquipuribacter sp. SD81 TaxID=3127703 RepID=UPI0030194A01